MSIDNLIKNFGTYEELKIFCETQHKQILKLSKEVKELTASLANAPKMLPATSKLDVPGEDAKIISQIQLNLLKQVSFERELTSDEAKRVELFNKILKDELAKDKDKPKDVEKASEGELLRLVGGSDNV